MRNLRLPQRAEEQIPIPIDSRITTSPIIFTSKIDDLYTDIFFDIQNNLYIYKALVINQQKEIYDRH
jgi:hypothetical protein